MAEVDDAVGRLKGLAEALLELADGLQEHSARGDDDPTVLERLALAERDEREMAERLVSAEAQIQKLTRLYVATERLHATLQVAQVTEAICEIAVDMLGAERFVLLRADEHSRRYLIAAAEGITSDDFPFFGATHFAGGDALTDAALGTGEVQLGRDPSGPLAAIPLTAEGERIGALVVLKLFDHRGALGSADYDLIELLAAHAASALFAAMLHHSATRKLQTLEGVVELARGGLPALRKATQ